MRLTIVIITLQWIHPFGTIEIISEQHGWVYIAGKGIYTQFCVWGVMIRKPMHGSAEIEWKQVLSVKYHRIAVSAPATKDGINRDSIFLT